MNWIYLILKYFKAFVLSSEKVKNNCKLFCVCTFDISRVSNIMFVARTFFCDFQPAMTWGQTLPVACGPT